MMQLTPYCLLLPAKKALFQAYQLTRRSSGEVNFITRCIIPNSSNKVCSRAAPAGTPRVATHVVVPMLPRWERTLGYLSISCPMRGSPL